MLQVTTPQCRAFPELEERVQRQRYVLAKLERDGYACEVQAARRMLRSLESQLAAARQRRVPQA